MLVVRHAESKFIKAYNDRKQILVNNETALSPYERELYYNEFAVSVDFLDAELTQEGIKQCLSTVLPEDLPPIVYVSPFRRTIQTACYLLLLHPKKQSFVIKLDPLLKEYMSYQNTMMQSKTSLLQYCHQMTCDFDIKIDASFVEPYSEYWYWESHLNQQVAEQLLALVEDRTYTQIDHKVFNLVKAKALQVLPGSFETYNELLERAMLFKSKTDLPYNTLVVTHSGMVNALKSTHVMKNGKLNAWEHIGLCSVHRV